MLFVGLQIVPGFSSGQPVVSAQGDSKILLAFYYTWFEKENFEDGSMPDRPMDPYSSARPETIQRQVIEAHGAGITGFIAAWTGFGTDTDTNFETLLNIAAAHDFKATIYFETPTIMKSKNVSNEIRDFIAKYGSHPAFLRWQGKPVIFFWHPQEYKNLEAWKAIRSQLDPGHAQHWSAETTEFRYLDAFDSVHSFSACKWNEKTDAAKEQIRFSAEVDAYNRKNNTQRTWIGGIIPGWDETRVGDGRPNPKRIPRREGELYKEMWQAATGTNPDIITITSWNEWKEDTQIEPAVSYRTTYLDLTREYAAKWRGTQDSPALPLTPEVPIIAPTQAPEADLPPTPAIAPVSSPVVNSTVAPTPRPLPTTGNTSAAVTSQCAGGTSFAQIGKSICKVLEPYWRKYGGLSQFGYPISDPLEETSITDGQVYLVQYFERARFEWHPKNQNTPYEVELGLLGAEEYERRYPTGAPGQWVNNSSGRYFAETQHRVAGAFWLHWQSHGGLFAYGYPVSDEFQERLEDGRVYTLQYFQRVRFEWHPENREPHRVLLGALGWSSWQQHNP
ncbi:MAG TPA: endo-1,3-alpha-glucanase family glycosylhydrolase [Chloroflexia bacterium]|jgi:hypothetical protein